MMKRLEKIFNRISSIGASDDDSEELRIQKSLLVISSFLFAMQVSAFSQVIPPDHQAPDVPITGNEILIGAGALLGARKFMRSRNKK